MELTENKDLLQTVFDSAAHGSAVMQSIYDEQGRVEDFSILLFNAAMLNWIGHVDYKGKRYSDVFPMTHETGILKKFIEVAETGVTTTFERWYDIEGTSHWFQFTAVKQAELVVVTTEDITERKQTEIALNQALDAAEKQKRLYDSITNTTPDLVYVFDLAYRFTYANKALLAMWGKTAAAAIGKGLRENGYEEWHALMHEREIDEVASTKKTIRGTVSFPHAELGKRIYDYILGPVLNEKGAVEAVAGITRDITELKRAEESLQQSEARFRNMIEQAPVAILLSKGEDVVIESINNPMLQFMNKTSVEEVLGKKMLEALPELAGQPALQTVINVQKTGIPFRGDEQPVDLFINGNLERRYFNFSYTSIKEASETSAVLHMAVDATEQVIARQKLEESESRFRNLVRDASAAIVVLTGPEMKVEIVNEAYGRLIGLNPEYLLGKSLFSVIPDTEAYYRPLLEGVRQTGEPVYLYDSPYAVTTNGRLIEGFLHVVYQPYRDKAGNILGVMAILQDVTESVKARKLLEASEAKFRSVIEDAPVAIGLFVGRDLVIQDPNQSFVDIVGKGWSIVGKPLREAMPELITEGQPYLQILDDVFTTGKAFNTAGSLVKIVQNGVLTHRYYNFTYSPLFDEEGKVWALLDIAIDVTDQVEASQKVQESEERFRMLSDEMPQFVWTGDADGNLGYFNQAVYTYSGLSKEEIANEGWVQIVHPEDREENIRLWQHSIATGKDFIFEHRFKRADGEYRWQLSRAVPQRDAQGIIQQWIGTSTDIQEQKNVEKQLESLVAERTKELQRSNEDLQQFAHVASHDLKEPVRKIKTFASRLEEQLDGKLDETATRFMERIHVATDRMFTMIDGVLTYSTINADTQKPEAVDLNEVVKNIESDLELALQKTDGIIQYHDLPILEGAPVLLYQLFYNLINNSIKFAKAGVPPQITIASEIVVEHQRNFARITLQDNGIGFDSDQTGRIFETFTRLNSKDKYEGTGLGLSLCKKIVERHGGTIIANGTPGQGATFALTLPLQQKEKSI